MICFASVFLVSIAGITFQANAFTSDGQEDICSDPNVIFCENFENRSLGHAYNVLGGPEFKNNGWLVSGSEPQNYTMDVVNTESFDGSKAMQWTYPSGTGAGFMDGYFPEKSHIFIRFYLKNESNWVWSHNGEKMDFVGGPSFNHMVMWDQSANCNPGPVCDTPTVDPTIGASQFYYSTGHFPLNQWVCMEEEMIMANPAGSNTGTLRQWMDGTQILDVSGVNTSNSDTTANVIAPSGYWNCTSGSNFAVPCDQQYPENQHPVMHRWIDNIVVSTQRIGCLGSAPPPNTTPPAAPEGLKVL